MKLKLLLTFTALVLTLCFILTACGEQQTGSATDDSATPDSAATIDTASAPANAASSSASSKEEDASASSAASSAVKAAPAPEVNNGTPEVSHQEDTPVQEEQQAEEKSASSAAPSSQASSKSSSSSSGNPAYKEDEKPIFTISLTNQSTKKTYSASCSYTTDKEEVASAPFYLPGGEYEIAVYEYTENKDKGEPLAKATYKNSIAEDKRRSVHVNYTPKDGKIEVVVSTSSRTQ